MEFKKAYLKLGSEKTKFEGKTLKCNNLDNLYEVSHLYISVKNPSTDDIKEIRKLNIELYPEIDTQIYRFLKDKDCNIFLKLKQTELEKEIAVPLEEISNYQLVEI